MNTASKRGSYGRQLREGRSSTCSKNQLVWPRCHFTGLASGMDWASWSSADSGSARRSVRARTTSGDLRFVGKLTRGAEFEATTVSGDLNVRANADGGFAYEVSSFSGDISDCFNANPERASQYGPGTRLQGTRGEGAGRVRLKTMSGDIQLCDRS